MEPYSKCQPVCWVLSKTTGRPGVLQSTGGFNPGGAMQAAATALPGHRIFQLSHIPSSAAVPAWSLPVKSLCLIQNNFFTQSWLFFPALVYQKKRKTPLAGGAGDAPKTCSAVCLFLIFTSFQVHCILSYF